MKWRKRALAVVTKPFCDYTPPQFLEFRDIVGDEFGTLQNYNSMCLAMECKVYDRAEAFERLAGIAASQKEMEALWERFNASNKSD